MKTNKLLCTLGLSVLCATPGLLPTTLAQSPPQSSEVKLLRIRDFQPIAPICRAQRSTELSAIVENRSDSSARVSLALTLPSGLHLIGGSAQINRVVQDQDESRITWTVKADKPGDCKVSLTARSGGQIASSSVVVSFLPAVTARKLARISEPQPVKTDMMVGALACPLWEADRPEMWTNIVKHPERTPALGFYAQENPEVSDWETKWATEHGISFFIYCWYRNGQGGPVKQNFGSAIHQGLFHSRFRTKMRYAIMWENQARGQAGVSDEHDLLQNLFPFWMQNYFKDPGYQVIDNKPVLYIYRPEFLVQDLGSVENVRRAMDAMRRKCAEAGFAGLYILGEYRGLDPAQFRLDKDLGMDATFPYCLGGPDKGTPEQIIQAQVQYDTRASEIGILPKLITASQAWSGWNDEGPLWKLPPSGFETLLRKAKDLAAKEPAGSLSSRIVLLDNWNEWGEGHYIAPYREYGFGYLDAVRKVFAPGAAVHSDLVPEDIGLGPYDRAYRTERERSAELRREGNKKIIKPGGDEPGLLAWWSFDEQPQQSVALDGSGHRLGGLLSAIHRAPGIVGSALKCDGGCVLVAPSPLFAPEAGLSIECWIKADRSGQSNNWMVNRVLSGGTSTGFRLGLINDRPCFEVPLTDFSHHLTAADPISVGRWTHICGTFDNQTMRLYVNGKLAGTMERPGAVRPNGFDLCLGNYTSKHSAYFSGLLDEVKLYGRALTDVEVMAHYRQLSDRAQ